jgi:hypothetical protein
VNVKRAMEKRFTAAQMANVEERIATVNRILDRMGNEAAQQGANLGIWRKANMELLYALSLPALQQTERNAHSLDGLAGAIRSAAEDPNLIGDPNADLVYTPINPCRYIDTRGGPPVSPASPRGYDLVNNGAFYGGDASCTMLQNVAAAVAVNVTIDQAGAGPAFLAVKPTLAAPTTSFMNWTQAGTQLANAGVVTLDQGIADPEFFILVSSPTHVLVDFFGYFAEPEATALDNFVALTTQNVAASAQFSIFSPICPAGYRLTGGGRVSTAFGAPAFAAGSRPVANNSIAVISGANVANQWLCQGVNTAVAQDYHCFAVCARTPGR